MTNPQIIAYCFNSSIVCPSCTDAAFENGELVREKPAAGEPRRPPHYDEHNLPDDLTNTDEEEVRPIFSTDDYPDGITCDECGEQIP